VPAVGFSLGLERVLLVMEERSMFPPLGIGPQVLLCRMSDVPADAAIRVASQMRAQGLRVEIYADSANMGKMLTYANTIGAPFAAILGTSELVQGTLAMKCLKSGEQGAVPVVDASVFVSKRS
jgi:histidyl-tRNA synthetase